MVPWRYVDFFCGNNNYCTLSDKTSEDLWYKGFLQAMHNVEMNFFVVGVLEQFEDTLKLFEKMMPRIYTGALEAYHSPSKFHILFTQNSKYSHVKPKLQRCKKKELRLKLLARLKWTTLLEITSRLDHFGTSSSCMPLLVNSSTNDFEDMASSLMPHHMAHEKTLYFTVVYM